MMLFLLHMLLDKVVFLFGPDQKLTYWPLFVMSTCYAMNTFVSPITGFSPYELVFLKKPIS